MKTAITAGLDPALVSEIKGSFKSSSVLRKRLQDILEAKVQEHFKAQYNRKNYEDPNWSFEQADSMGYIRALREVVSLLDDGKKEPIEKKPMGRPPKFKLKPKPLI